MKGYLDIIIVNFRQPGLTIDCIKSLEDERTEFSNFTVWLCENGSGDNSAEVLRKAIADNQWESWVKLRVSLDNTGFSGGNNLLIHEALQQPTPEADEQSYVFLLNNDTIVRPGALKTLVEFMNSTNADACSSRLEDPDGTIQRSAFRFFSLRSELAAAVNFGPISGLFQKYHVAPEPPTKPCVVDWVAGASLLVKRRIIREVGLLDHGFWTYFEDVDYCHRLKIHGYSLWYVPEARIVHLVGASSGITADKAWMKRRPAYWFQARRRYFLKYQGFTKTLIIDAIEIIGSAIGLLIKKLRNQDPHRPVNFLKDFWAESAIVKGSKLPVVEAPKPK